MLDDKGFHRPTYAELLKEQETRAKELFGDDIDTSETTALGKFIRLSVYDFAKVYEVAEKVYYARFPNYATGQSLDRLLPFANITRNPATAARHIIEFFGTANKEIEVGTLVTTADNINFYTLKPVTIEDDGTGNGRVQVEVECTQLGTIGNVEVGLIDRLVNPNAFIQSVTHISLVLIAKDTETDVALRKRLQDTLKGTGAGTYEALYGALTRLPYVDGVVIAENETHEFDKDGRPPHSFQCYIVAPESIDNDIAQTIFDKKPVGIKCLGEVEIDVNDKGGFPHTMRFSRAVEVPIELKIQVKVNVFAAENVVEEIKTNLMNFVNGMKNGEDVILTKMYSYIHKVEGVEETSELLIKAKDRDFEAANVICSPVEYARVTKERISIEVVDYVDL
jgi:uncharacterized phage protein gp47/JayE